MVVGGDSLYKKKKKIHVYLRSFVILFVVLLVVISFWPSFFSYKECNNLACFNKYLESCRGAKFIGGSDMIFEYSILGIRGESCRVNVKLLQGELNNQDSLVLEGQSMVCDVARGQVILPESDIGNCHGLLKENLQDLLIKKMYSYLVQNIGQIGGERFDYSG